MTDGTPLDLPALRKLAAKATPGPWCVRQDASYRGSGTSWHPGVCTEGLYSPIVDAANVDLRNTDETLRNLEFIVAFANQFGALDAALTQIINKAQRTLTGHAPKGFSCSCDKCEEARAALRALGMGEDGNG